MSRHLRHDSVLVVFDGEWGATPAPHHAISNNHSGGDRRGGGQDGCGERTDKDRYEMSFRQRRETRGSIFFVHHLGWLLGFQFGPMFDFAPLMWGKGGSRQRLGRLEGRLSYTGAPPADRSIYTRRRSAHEGRWDRIDPANDAGKTKKKREKVLPTEKTRHRTRQQHQQINRSEILLAVNSAALAAPDIALK